MLLFVIATSPKESRIPLVKTPTGSDNSSFTKLLFSKLYLYAINFFWPLRAGSRNET